MELSTSQINAFQTYVKTIGKGLFTDVDLFVNYLGVYPDLTLMVDVNWDILKEIGKDMAYNYNRFLLYKFEDDIRLFFKMMNIPYKGRVSFNIINWD